MIRISPRSLILGAAGRALGGRALCWRTAVCGRNDDLGAAMLGSSLFGSLQEIRGTAVAVTQQNTGIPTSGEGKAENRWLYGLPQETEQ